MLADLPAYLAYAVTSLLLLAVFLAIYVVITPYREIRLIREGNRAAALSFGGTTIGLGIALFSVLAGATSLLDLALWGVVALSFQLLAFFVARLLLTGLREGIEGGRDSYGLTLGAMSIAVGFVNAGALTY
jgi:putative membrane protein